MIHETEAEILLQSHFQCGCRPGLSITGNFHHHRDKNNTSSAMVVTQILQKMVSAHWFPLKYLKCRLGDNTCVWNTPLEPTCCSPGLLCMCCCLQGWMVTIAILADKLFFPASFLFLMPLHINKHRWKIHSSWGVWQVLKHYSQQMLKCM